MTRTLLTLLVMGVIGVPVSGADDDPLPPILDASALPTAQEADLFPLQGGSHPRFVVSADGGHSIDLGDRRVLWLFGDTVVGHSPDRADVLRFKEELADGQVGRCNTAALMTLPAKDRAFELSYWAPAKGLKNHLPVAGQAIPFVEGESFDAGDRIWPVGGLRAGDWVYVFIMLTNAAKPEAPTRYSLARSPATDPLRFQRLSARDGRPLVLPFPARVGGAISLGPLEIGRSPWIEGAYLYSFATYAVRRTQRRGLPGERTFGMGWATSLVRVPMTRLDEPDAWEVAYGQGRWGKVRESARSFFELQGHAVSVHRNECLGKWVAAYAPLAVPTINDELEVVARVADSPEGPWSNAVEIFRAPAAPKAGHTPLFGEQPASNIYVAELHPWSSPDGGRTMLLTFNDARRGRVHAARVDLSRLRIKAGR
ncbi:DUF4185 domain-containing protein [Aquisphaera insulae]|uniref:DUF4185 domain-containing protein n=1 Tax=Aquisphaera insulae TaxID=2712864 RepID=UPI0013EB68CA|nr:DUF4185 domain-containing protein [Aquisphaera insulae]